MSIKKDEGKKVGAIYNLNNKFVLKNISISIIIIILLIQYIFYNIKIYKHKKIIFSFWEPKNKIPGYLSLCIKTWKVFLPDYKIIILDYDNISKYLGKELYKNIICKHMYLSMQADAIRIAILNKYGGLWMDTDSIILNGNFTKEYNKYKLTMIGEEKNKFQYMGFIFASQNSNILNIWLRKIINKVKKYKKILHQDKSKLTKKMKRFDYLGNSVIDPILGHYTKNDYCRIDSKSINAFPENIYIKNNTKTKMDKYEEFYFQKGDPNIILKNTKYIILLHNSWTPSKYKNMNEKEFLMQDIRISKLLSKLLKIK